MMTIANPIYDSVFKFLMEDERVARTILSALLKKDILRVEVRPHEHSNSAQKLAFLHFILYLCSRIGASSCKPTEMCCA